MEHCKADVDGCVKHDNNEDDPVGDFEVLGADSTKDSAVEGQDGQLDESEGRVIEDGAVVNSLCMVRVPTVESESLIRLTRLYLLSPSSPWRFRTRCTWVPIPRSVAESDSR